MRAQLDWAGLNNRPIRAQLDWAGLNNQPIRAFIQVMDLRSFFFVTQNNHVEDLQ